MRTADDEGTAPESAAATATDPDADPAVELERSASDRPAAEEPPTPVERESALEPAGSVATIGRPPGYQAWNLVTVVDVRMDLPAANPEVVLQESSAPWRELRIPLGMAEGTAIAYALRGPPTPRPLTHALLAELLERHGVEVEAARITTRTRRLFGAELDTVGPKGRQVVPCRPSDAIALVLRQRLATPLLAAEWVFDNVADAAQADASPADASPADAAPADAAPADAAPADASPADAAPADASPADGSPADRPRAD